jgi:hypothetical protein
MVVKVMTVFFWVVVPCRLTGTLKMETVHYSKIVSTIKSTWRHNPKEHHRAISYIGCFQNIEFDSMDSVQSNNHV